MGQSDLHLEKSELEKKLQAKEQAETEHQSLISKLKDMLVKSGCHQEEQPHRSLKRRRETWCPGKKKKKSDIHVLPTIIEPVSDDVFQKIGNRSMTVNRKEEKFEDLPKAKPRMSVTFGSPPGILDETIGTNKDLKELFQLQNAYEALSEEHQALSEEHQALSEEHQALSEAHQALSEEHEALSEGLAQQKVEFVELEEFTTLERNMNEEADKELKKKVEELECSHGWMEEELMKVQQQRNALRQEVETMKRRLTAVEDQSGISEANSRLSTTQAKMVSLTADKDAEASRNEFNLRQMKVKEELYIQLLEEKGVSPEEIKKRVQRDSTAQAEGQSQSATKMEEMRTRHQKEVEDLRDEVDQYMQKFEHERKERNKEVSELQERYESELLELKEDVSIYQNLMAEVKSKTTDNSDAESLELKTEINLLKDSFEAQRAQYEQEIETLKMTASVAEQRSQKTMPVLEEDSPDRPLNEEMDFLKQRNKELTEQAEEHKGELEIQRATYEQQLSEMKSLNQNASATIGSNSDNLASEIVEAELHRQRISYEERITELKSEIGIFVDLLGEKKKDNSSVRTELEDAATKKFQEELETQKLEYEQKLSDMKVEMEEKVTEMKREIEMYNNLLEETKEQQSLTKTEVEPDNAQNLHEDMDTLKNEYEQKLSDMRVEIQEKNEEIEVCMRLLEEKRMHNSSVRAECETEARKLRDDLETQKIEYEQKLCDMKMEMETCNQVMAQQAENKTQKFEYEQKLSDMKVEMEEKVTEMKREIEMYNNLLEETKEQQSLTKTEVEPDNAQNLQEDMDTLKNEYEQKLSDMRVEIQEKNEEIEVCMRLLEEKRMHNSSVRAECETVARKLRDDLETQKIEYERKLSDMKMEMETCNQVMAQQAENKSYLDDSHVGSDEVREVNLEKHTCSHEQTVLEVKSGKTSDVYAQTAAELGNSCPDAGDVGKSATEYQAESLARTHAYETLLAEYNSAMETHHQTLQEQKDMFEQKLSEMKLTIDRLQEQPQSRGEKECLAVIEEEGVYSEHVPVPNEQQTRDCTPVQEEAVRKLEEEMEAQKLWYEETIRDMKVKHEQVVKSLQVQSADLVEESGRLTNSEPSLTAEENLPQEKHTACSTEHEPPVGEQEERVASLLAELDYERQKTNELGFAWLTEKESLEQKISDLKDDVKTCNELLLEHEQSVSTMAVDLEMEQDRARSLESKLESEHNDYEQKIAELIAEMASFSEQLEEERKLSARSAPVGEDNELEGTKRLELEIESLTSSNVQQLSDAKMEFEKMLNEELQKSANLETRLETEQLRLRECEASLQFSSTDNEKLREVVQECQVELHTMKQEIQELGQQIEKEQARSKRLKEEKNQLQDKLLLKQQNLGVAGKESSEYEVELQRLLQTSEEKVTTLECSLEEETVKTRRLEETLDQTERKLNSVEETLQSFSEEQNSLKQELLQEQRLSGELLGEKNNLQEQLLQEQRLSGELLGEKNDLQEQLLQEQRLSGELLGEKKDSQEQLLQEQRLSGELLREKNDLQEQLLQEQRGGELLREKKDLQEQLLQEQRLSGELLGEKNDLQEQLLQEQRLSGELLGEKNDLQEQLLQEQRLSGELLGEKNDLQEQLLQEQRLSGDFLGEKNDLQEQLLQEQRLSGELLGEKNDLQEQLLQEQRLSGELLGEKNDLQEKLLQEQRLSGELLGEKKDIQEQLLQEQRLSGELLGEKNDLQEQLLQEQRGGELLREKKDLQEQLLQEQRHSGELLREKNDLQEQLIQEQRLSGELQETWKQLQETIVQGQKELDDLKKEKTLLDETILQLKKGMTIANFKYPSESGDNEWEKNWNEYTKTEKLKRLVVYNEVARLQKELKKEKKEKENAFENALEQVKRMERETTEYQELRKLWQIAEDDANKLNSDWEDEKEKTKVLQEKLAKAEESLKSAEGNVKASSSAVCDDHPCKYRLKSMNLQRLMTEAAEEHKTRVKQYEETIELCEGQVKNMKREMRRIQSMDNTFSMISKPTDEQPQERISTSMSNTGLNPVSSSKFPAVQGSSSSGGIVDHYKLCYTEAENAQLKKDLAKQTAKLKKLEQATKEMEGLQSQSKKKLLISTSVQTDQPSSATRAALETSSEAIQDQGNRPKLRFTGRVPELNPKKKEETVDECKSQ